MMNSAWKAVAATENLKKLYQQDPARLLQRWKPSPKDEGRKVANAQVILQGKDVLTKEIATEAPTF